MFLVHSKFFLGMTVQNPLFWYVLVFEPQPNKTTEIPSARPSSQTMKSLELTAPWNGGGDM